MLSLSKDRYYVKTVNAKFKYSDIKEKLPYAIILINNSQKEYWDLSAFKPDLRDVLKHLDTVSLIVIYDKIKYMKTMFVPRILIHKSASGKYESFINVR